MRAARSGVVQPAPTFEHAPSPSAGSHGTRASAGQRAANSGRSPRNGRSRSTIGPSWSGESSSVSRMARIPAARPLVEEAGPRRHRDARPELAEEAEAEVLAERHPAAHGAGRVRVALLEPPDAAPAGTRCGAGSPRGRGRPSRRRARAAPRPRPRSGCRPTSRPASAAGRPRRDRGACARTCRSPPRRRRPRGGPGRRRARRASRPPGRRAGPRRPRPRRRPSSPARTTAGTRVRAHGLRRRTPARGRRTSRRRARPRSDSRKPW